MFELLDFQVAPAAQLLDVLRRHGAALDASDTGIGKTYVATWCAVQSHRPILVVCPKVVIPTWREVLEDAGANVVDVVNYEWIRRAKNGEDRYGQWNRAGKVPYWEWNVPAGTLLIFDEVHRCKGRGGGKERVALNAALLRGTKRQHLWTLCLSATCAENPLEMKALGNRLGLFDMQNYWSWATKHGVAKDWAGHYVWPRDPGRTPKQQARYRKAQSGLQRIHGALFPEHGIRIRKNEVPGFPECQTTAELLDFEATPKLRWPALNAAVKDMQEKLAAAETPMEEITYGRELSEFQKIPVLMDIMKDELEDGYSVVVFLNYRLSIELLRDRCQDRMRTYPVRWYYGQQPDRDQHKKDFQCDRARIIIVQIQAGGLGLSLHDLNGRFPRQALICPTYSAIDFKQALGRIHRAGAKSRAIQRLLYAAGGIEEIVYHCVRSKLDNLDRINDGDLVDQAPTITARTTTKEVDMGRKKNGRQERTSRKSFHCSQCSSSVSKGAKYFRWPNDDAKGDRFCSEQCLDTFLAANKPPEEGQVGAAAGSAEVPAIDIDQVISAAWGANPFTPEVGAVNCQPVHLFLIAKQIGMDDQNPDGIYECVKAAFNGDPFAEGDQAPFTKYELLVFAEHCGAAITPAPAEAETETPAEPTVELEKLPDAERANALSPAKMGFQVLKHYICAHLGIKIPQEVHDSGDIGALREWNAGLVKEAVAWWNEASADTFATVATTRQKEEPEHHRYGMSSLWYREVCPGWCGREGDSEASLAGTRMHEACEASLKMQSEVPVFDVPNPDPDEVDLVRKALQGVQALYGITFRPEQQIHVQTEVKLRIPDVNYGTADVLATVGQWGLLVDYKFGWHPVADAEVNPQIRGYALAAFYTFPALMWIRAAIVQPRLDLIDYVDITRDEAMQMDDMRIRTIVSKAMMYDKDPETMQEELNPTDACKYCGRIATCPVVNTRALAVAQSWEPTHQLPSFMDPAKLQTPEDLALGMKLAKVLEEWIPAMKAHAKSMVIDHGINVPGYEIQHRSGRRVIQDLPLVWAELERLYPSIDKDEFLRLCTVGKGDLEKMIKDASDRGQKGKNVEAFETWMVDQGHLQGGDGYTVLAESRKSTKELSE